MVRKASVWSAGRWHNSRNGILRLGMSGASRVVSNFNSASTLILTNTILRNTGTIALDGGGLIMEAAA